MSLNTKTIIKSDKQQIIKGKILLATLKAENNTIYSYGSEIEIEGQLNIPKGKRNPGGFDYQKIFITIRSKCNNFCKKQKYKNR